MITVIAKTLEKYEGCPQSITANTVTECGQQNVFLAQYVKQCSGDKGSRGPWFETRPSRRSLWPCASHI